MVEMVLLRTDSQACFNLTVAARHFGVLSCLLHRQPEIFIMSLSAQLYLLRGVHIHVNWNRGKCYLCLGG